MCVFVLFRLHVKIVAFSQSVQKVSNVSLSQSVVDNTGGVTVSWNPVNGINVDLHRLLQYRERSNFQSPAKWGCVR